MASPASFTPPVTAATEFADVLKFRFDADVQASDGEAGRVVAVVLDPSRSAITHAGLRPQRFFGGAICFIPTERVTAGTADAITLDITRTDIERERATPNGIVLNDRTQISLGGKTIGRLAQLTIHRHTRTIRHLVIERNLGKEYLIPARLITGADERRITVDLGGANINQLTPYRDDADLQQEAHDAIYDYSRLRVDLPGITIHAIDGVIWLKGHVASELNRRLVEDQIQNIPGLAELHNDLYADEQLAAAVSMALSHDPRTASQRIGVYPRLGEMHLRGSVTSQSASDAALTIARAVPGVGNIVNELRVDPTGEVIPVLAGVTNAEDQVPG